MARRARKHAANHERWLVSYADLLTLLFAFFVVMFASSQTDHGRAKEISEAVDKAFRSSSLPPQLAYILGGTPDDTGRGNTQLKGAGNPKPKKQDPTELPRQLDLTSTLKALQTKLAEEIDHKSVRLHVEPRGIVIGLNAQVIFPSGGDTIDETVYPTIAKVAGVLGLLPNSIRLEGHTDSLPISNAHFRSNWELSAARSIAMLRLLHERYGVSLNRMAVVGYGETNALGDNETESGRTRNRRVDIVIVSDFGMRAEPAKELVPAKGKGP